MAKQSNQKTKLLILWRELLRRGDEEKPIPTNQLIETLAREGVSADKVLREARQAADGYIRQGKVWNRRLERLPAPVWGAVGAVLASAGWVLWLFLL